jgi:saccharopine dehydrogenase-like NADP-dependent oxidoreductase
LTEQNYQVTAYDTHDQPGSELIQGTRDDYFNIAQRHDAVVVATPHQINLQIAEACFAHEKAYFDMTEDVAIASTIHKNSKGFGKHFCMPQCGLAPGVVSLLATHLASKFDPSILLESIEIRVGALPQTTNNKLKYYLTWSPDGLINEYSNPCRAVINQQNVDLVPLEGYETLTVNGREYEAFNTSGGIGNLVYSMKHRAKNINYKTMRYKGHRDLMNFLFDDLNLKNRKELLVELFKQEVPHVTDDLIVIVINVMGRDNRGNLKTEQYFNHIYGNEEFNAIQLTTAAGLCVSVDWWAKTAPSQMEDIPFDFFNLSPFGKIYLTKNR